MPLHDQIIEKLDSTQLILYQALIAEDNKQDYEEKRDLVEYLAAFVRPEAMQQVLAKRRREQEDTEAGIASENDEVFSNQVAKMFGKALPKKETR